MRVCCAGLAGGDGIANGIQSHPQSASNREAADTHMAFWSGWDAAAGINTGASWGQDDNDIQWENADNAENVDPGTQAFTCTHQPKAATLPVGNLRESVLKRRL